MRCNPFEVAPNGRDLDLPWGHYSRVPKMSQKEHVFSNFSTITGWNHLRFFAFVTLHSLITKKIKRILAGSKQRLSESLSQKVFNLYFLHSRNSTENTNFQQVIFISQFPDVPNGFNSSIRRCNNLFQGLGASSINTFDVITLSFMGPPLRFLYTKKIKCYSFNLYWGRLENVLAVVFCTTKLKKRVFGLL